MIRLRLAIIGYGKLGRACAEAILRDESLLLAGIVRRPEHASERLPPALKDVPVAAHINALPKVDAALLCLPADMVAGAAHDLMQHRIPIVECAIFHGDDFLSHKEEMDRMANHFKVPAIVGAGWDPGALSLFRNLFALFCPHGHTQVSRRPGISLHHSTVAATVPGVKAAMATELRSAEGVTQNYFYLELEEEVDVDEVEAALRRDPLFAGEAILIFPVDTIAELEESGHGVLLERRASADAEEHRLFLLEARFSEYALSAQVMTAAVKAIIHRGKRAYSLMDLPLGSLWGALRETAEKEWE